LHDASDQVLLTNRLAEYQQQIEWLSTEIATAREGERNQIARDLHDELGQLLTICHLGIGRTFDNVDNKSAKELGYIDSLLLRSIACLRRVRSGPKSPIFTELSLTSALRELVDEFSRFASLKIDVAIEEIGEFSPEVSSVAYRTVQEALTNIIRHANADAARVEVSLNPDLVVVVSDNGSGISDAANAMHRGYGLLGMQERVEGVNGLLAIETNVPTGTCLRVVLPARFNAKSPPVGGVFLESQLYSNRGR
jgi:signal transduction histidine kinase